MGQPFDAIVVGAGPAGSAFAAVLARGGGRVALVDGRPPHFAKPCGGAFPFDALKHDLPACARDLEGSVCFPSAVEVVSSAAAQAHLKTIARVSLGVCDRRDLDDRLRAEAQHWGAVLISGRAEHVERGPSGWRVGVGCDLYQASVLIGAGGWQSHHRGVRRLCMGDHGPTVRFLAGCGAYLEGVLDPRVLRVDLPEALAGYGWAFTGRSHTSIGCIGPFACEGDWRPLADAFEALLREQSGALPIRSRFHCILPCVRPDAPLHPISGDTWAVVGDAAGLVDPITGAGLLYAMRSGILAAESLLLGDLRSYAEQWWGTAEGRHILMASRAYEAALRLTTVAGPWPVHELVKESYCSL